MKIQPDIEKVRENKKYTGFNIKDLYTNFCTIRFFAMSQSGHSEVVAPSVGTDYVGS